MADMNELDFQTIKYLDRLIVIDMNFPALSDLFVNKQNN